MRSRLGTTRKQLENGHHNRSWIACVGAAAGRLIERALPLIDLEQRSTRLKAKRPVRRKVGQGTTSARGVAEQTPDAILAEAVEQDVGKRSARLPLARCEDRHAVREMEREIGVRHENQEVLIPVLGGRGADRDLIGSRTARGNELAHPTQRFDRLGARISARNYRYAGSHLAVAGNELPRKPVRARRAGIAPSERDRLPKRRKKRPPDGCNLAELIDVD
ncbi:hypothetical protein M2207_007495 [Bradyrhizobium japonicum]|uniref:hypothetical protein n=1 Tax=Bradyrhizobium japonicum TaxID=375 RepID=UPI00216A6284|nr:hypothetical protein [Bradyrhizobium japonicum]MCS3502272.1 hypothetical protein [Bradyrhizobium japonicum]